MRADDLIKEWLREEGYNPISIGNCYDFVVNGVWFELSAGMTGEIWCDHCAMGSELDFMNNDNGMSLDDPHFFEELKAYIEKHRDCLIRPRF